MKYLKYISPINIFIYICKISIVMFVFIVFLVPLIFELVYIILLSFEYTEANKKYIKDITEVLKEITKAVIYKT